MGANFNFNKVILGGRLCTDPELKTTTNGTSVTSFSVAITRKHSKEEQVSDFISVVAWRKTAEFITQYFRKGSSISIVGSLQTRNYTTDSGEKRYVTEVLAEEAYFVDSKNESQPTIAPAGHIPSAYTEQPVMEEISVDEDLPF